MRPFYFFLKNSFTFGIRLYYRTVRITNNPKRKRSSVILACNHPSAFMDPLIIASLGNVVVHFMTRSDVFTKFLNPILWSVQMLPIYRQQDKGDTKGSNERIFKICQKLLYNKKGLILFAEGFTDDHFIRSLKPVKKGAARIAFGTMERYKWELDLKIQACGLNYTDPNLLRSDVNMVYGKSINVIDWKERYKQDPNLAITELTREIESNLQDAIVYLADKSKSTVLENAMIVTRKGMNPHHFDFNLTIEDRRIYGQKLAIAMNEANEEQIQILEQSLDAYFEDEHYNLANEETWYRKSIKRSIYPKEYLSFLLSPVLLLGLIHGYLPYSFTKRFVEKSFKRRVFWSGVKMGMGHALMGIYNIPIVILLNYFVFHDALFSWIYYFTVPGLSFVFTHYFFNKLLPTIKKVKSGIKSINSHPNQAEAILKKRQSAIQAVEHLLRRNK